MPLVRPCPVPRCPGYAGESGYCDDHVGTAAASRAEREAVRTARLRRRIAKRVYDDGRWTVCRLEVLRRAEGACERCGSDVNVTVHHILGITGTDDDFDPEMCAAACGLCHPAMDEERRAGR